MEVVEVEFGGRECVGVRSASSSSTDVGDVNGGDVDGDEGVERRLQPPAVLVPATASLTLWGPRWRERCADPGVPESVPLALALMGGVTSFSGEREDAGQLLAISQGQDEQTDVVQQPDRIQLGRDQRRATRAAMLPLA